MTLTAPPSAPDVPELVLAVDEDELGIAGQFALRHRLEQALSSRPRSLTVDLGRCRYADAPGLGVLADAGRDAARQGTRLQLRGCSTGVLRLIVVAGEAEHLSATA